VVSDKRASEVLLLNDAPGVLANVDGRKCQMVEMRYFSGLSTQETARLLRASADPIATLLRQSPRMRPHTQIVGGTSLRRNG
jgi:hypothetical protein